MPNLAEITTWLHDRLPALLAEHQVPGAAVAVSAGGDVIDVAAGVLSKATGVEATADSVFQVGSITKLWTSTLVMQLADEGKLEIDAPVHRYTGSYACDVAHLTVSQDEDGRSWLEHVPQGALAELVGRAERRELVQLYGDTLISVRSHHGIHQPHVFVGDDGSGRALHIHSGRAVKRVTAP